MRRWKRRRASRPSRLTRGGSSTSARGPSPRSSAPRASCGGPRSSTRATRPPGSPSAGRSRTGPSTWVSRCRRRTRSTPSDGPSSCAPPRPRPTGASPTPTSTSAATTRRSHRRARVLFVAKGEFLDAARAYEAALALNPQGGWIALQLSHCLALAGELPRADAAARIAIRLQEEALSGKEGLRIVGAHVRLSHVHALAGRWGEALAELEAERRFLSTVGHALAARALVELNVRFGSAFARLGRDAEARAALAEALTRFHERLANGVDDPFTRYYAAQGCVLLGETEAALELLSGAAAARPALTLRRALVEPDFAPLRGEPAFRRLLVEHRIAAPCPPGRRYSPRSSSKNRFTSRTATCRR